jgi:hypothetical protein
MSGPRSMRLSHTGSAWLQRQTCLDDKSIDTEPRENEHPEQKNWQPARRRKRVKDGGERRGRSLGWWH